MSHVNDTLIASKANDGCGESLLGGGFSGLHCAAVT